MNLISIILIGIGLSIDSLVASITTGVCMAKIKFSNILKIALFMAVFQATMPLLGWLAGNTFESSIKEVDHWVAFILLAIIGGKMIYEGIKNKGSEGKCFCPSNNILLAGMALATSIDALIVGIGFGFLDVQILQPVLIIGGITLLFSASGVWIGHKIGNRFNSGLEIAGGIILIGLGIKILIEHLGIFQ